MAGPVASLLLRQPLTEGQLKELEGWLRGLSEFAPVLNVFTGYKYSLDFCVDKLSPFIRGTGEPSPSFTLTLAIPEAGREFHCECQDETSLIETFKCKPKEHLDIWAESSYIKEHQILAQLLIELADKFKADIVNLGGEINNLPDLPGKIVIIPFELNDRTTYSIQIVDVEFLKNWLNQPDFYLPG